MKENLEVSITWLMGSYKRGFLSEEELSALLKVPEPCLVIVKPHCLETSNTLDWLDTMIDNLQLVRLTRQYVGVTRQNVFDLYGDLNEVIRYGSDGNAFVESLVNSFTDDGRCLLMIVYGQDCYGKMKKIKKMLREMGAEDKFRNVLHCSDSTSEAIREITAFLH